MFEEEGWTTLEGDFMPYRKPAGDGDWPTFLGPDEPAPRDIIIRHPLVLTICETSPAKAIWPKIWEKVLLLFMGCILHAAMRLFECCNNRITGPMRAQERSNYALS